MIDEVVWVRLLKLTLGNTVYASSIVVSVFMGGLALGALLMARYCDRVQRHLRLYALLETCVTLTALLLPLGLKLADNIYIWFYQAFNPSHTLLLFVQVVISAGILLVPSMLMGSTLPLLGRFITSLERETGHLVGKLYALNTLGAATGCFLAGFIFIGTFGVMGSLYIAAALNLLVAFGGWFLSRFSGLSVTEAEEAVASIEPATSGLQATESKFYLLILAFFMSGLISIGYEILWMRSIVHLLGGVTYVFSAVLTVYLLGNVMGVALGSRLARKLKIPAVGFAVTLSLLGVCGIFYLQTLILWTSDYLPMVNKGLEDIHTWIPVSPYITKPLVQSLFLFLIPTILMGIGFPIALQAWANYMHQVGRTTGTAYGANTIGAVAGGILTGFVLIPWLGLQRSIQVLGLAGLWMAAWLCLSFARKSGLVRRLALVGLAVIITGYVFTTPKGQFDRIIAMNPELPKGDLLYVKEGTTTTVSVHRDVRDGLLKLFSSGQALAGESQGTRCDQKILGHLGVLLRQNTQRALSVGFGSGETTLCLSTHKLEGVYCVEIAREVVETALEFFTHINLGDELDSEINMIYMDAKNYLHLTDSRYDVIMNDSIHPRLFAENASLHTREYFESARDRLNENGLMVCWIPTFDMPVAVLDSILGTMMEVFPHVTIWYPNRYHVNFFWAVGSRQAQQYSPRYIQDELSQAAVHESLSVIDMNNSIDVLAYYICDKRQLSRQITQYHVNSDYSPFVEFCTDFDDPDPVTFNRYILEIRDRSLLDHLDWQGFSEEEKQEWIKEYEKIYDVSTFLLQAYGTQNGLEQLEYCMAGLALLPGQPALLDALEEANKRLYADSVRLIAVGRYYEALVLAQKIFDIDPRSFTGWMIRSGAMMGGGNLEKALIAARRAIRMDPDNANGYLNLGFILSALKKYDQAIDSYRKALQLNPDSSSAMESLAGILINDSGADYYNPGEAVRLAERACELTGYNQLPLLNTLNKAYIHTGRIREAVDTAEIALRICLAGDMKDEAENIRQLLKSLKARL